jgi:hypothetical protein
MCPSCRKNDITGDFDTWHQWPKNSQHLPNITSDVSMCPSLLLSALFAPTETKVSYFVLKTGVAAGKKNNVKHQTRWTHGHFFGGGL